MKNKAQEINYGRFFLFLHAHWSLIHPHQSLLKNYEPTVETFCIIKIVAQMRPYSFTRNKKEAFFPLFVFFSPSELPFFSQVSEQYWIFSKLLTEQTIQYIYRRPAEGKMRVAFQKESVANGLRELSKSLALHRHRAQLQSNRQAVQDLGHILYLHHTLNPIFSRPFFPFEVRDNYNSNICQVIIRDLK